MLTNREDRFANYQAAQERKGLSPQNRYMGGYNPSSSLSDSKEETTNRRGPSRYKSSNRSELMANSSPRPMASPLRQRQYPSYYATGSMDNRNMLEDQERSMPSMYQRPMRSRQVNMGHQSALGNLGSKNRMLSYQGSMDNRSALGNLGSKNRMLSYQGSMDDFIQSR